jgi:flagellar protein FlaG
MIENVSSSGSRSVDYHVKPVVEIPKVKEVTKEPKEHAQPQPYPQQAQPEDLMKKALESINDFLKDSNTHLKFNYHDDLKEYYVSVVDNMTNEVVREIPSKKLLDMYAAMREYVGLIVDRKV